MPNKTYDSVGPSAAEGMTYIAKKASGTAEYDYVQTEKTGNRLQYDRVEQSSALPLRENLQDMLSKISLLLSDTYIDGSYSRIPVKSDLRRSEIRDLLQNVFMILQSVLEEESSEIRPFDPEEIEPGEIRTSSNPLALLTLTKYINECRPHKMRSLGTNAIRDWLMSKEIIKSEVRQIIRHDTVYLPGDNAEIIGLRDFVTQKDGETPYHSLKLDYDGQLYVIGHLKEIADFAKKQ